MRYYKKMKTLRFSWIWILMIRRSWYYSHTNSHLKSIVSIEKLTNNLFHRTTIIVKINEVANLFWWVGNYETNITNEKMFGCSKKELHIISSLRRNIFWNTLQSGSKPTLYDHKSASKPNVVWIVNFWRSIKKPPWDSRGRRHLSKPNQLLFANFISICTLICCYCYHVYSGI